MAASEEGTGCFLPRGRSQSDPSILTEPAGPAAGQHPGNGPARAGGQGRSGTARPWHRVRRGGDRGRIVRGRRWNGAAAPLQSGARRSAARRSAAAGVPGCPGAAGAAPARRRVARRRRLAPSAVVPWRGGGRWGVAARRGSPWRRGEAES